MLRQLIVVSYGNLKMEVTDRPVSESHWTRLADVIAPHLPKGRTVLMNTQGSSRTCAARAHLLDAFKAKGISLGLDAITEFDQDATVALRLIRNNSAQTDAIIALTHSEIAVDLPTFFGREVLRARIGPYGLAAGEARIIHCESKTTDVLRATTP